MAEPPGYRALAMAHVDDAVSRGLDDIAAKYRDNEAFGTALNAFQAGVIMRIPVWAAPRVNELCHAAAAARVAEINRG